MRHAATLRSSAQRAGFRIDFTGLVEPDVETGIPAGRELVALGREATRTTPNPHVVDELAELVGVRAAVTAVEAAGAFTVNNRIVLATGQPVVASWRDRMMPILEQLNATNFSHSAVSKREVKTVWTRIGQRLGLPRS